MKNKHKEYLRIENRTNRENFKQFSKHELTEYILYLEELLQKNSKAANYKAETGNQYINDAPPDKLYQELKRLKSEFISTVSHEFRTPLALISSNIQLMKNFDGKLDADIKNKVYHRVSSALKNMEFILENVSFLEKDNLLLYQNQPVVIDFQKYCYEIVEQLELIDNKKNVINLDIDKNITYLKLDKKLLTHILFNILSNAIKFSPANSEVIFKALKRNKQLEIEIKDQGVGIPEKELKHIFQPFYRSSNVSDINGTGLGLSIVKKCVDLHKGTISISSKVNQGTIVKIAIPELSDENKHKTKNKNNLEDEKNSDY